MELCCDIGSETAVHDRAQQAEQLAFIGQFGLTVLHELRNPMAMLKSFSQLLPEKIDDKPFLRDFAKVIPQEAERVEALAQQLLDLSMQENTISGARTCTKRSRIPSSYGDRVPMRAASGS
jgi:signal transduction histidine kinase